MSLRVLPDLLRLAESQHGIVTRQQALGLGASPTGVDRLVRVGVVRTVLPGTYARTGLELGDEARALAAALYFGRDAVVSRRSAARLHGLPIASDGRVHLTTNVRSAPVPPWVVLHRTTRLPEHHRIQVHGIPATTTVRTLLDLCMESISHRALRRAVTQSLRDGVDMGDLRVVLDEVPHAPRSKRLRVVLAELSSAAAATRSELEERFRQLMEAAGMPPTAFNHPIVDIDGRTRFLDAVYLPERLPIELDSAEFHRFATDQHDDRQRANAVVLAGWLAPLRYTWWDITERGDRVVEEIGRALHAARTRAG